MAVNELLQKYKEAIDICQRHSLRMLEADLTLKYECTIDVDSKDIISEELHTSDVYGGVEDESWIEVHIMFDEQGMWRVIEEGPLEYTSEEEPEEYLGAICSNEELIQLLNEYFDKYSDAS